jgi:hypothetical protein
MDSSALDKSYYVRDLTSIGMPITNFFQRFTTDTQVQKYNPDRYFFYMQLLQGIMNPTSKNIVDTVLSIEASNRERQKRIEEKSRELADALSYLNSIGDTKAFDKISGLLQANPLTIGIKLTKTSGGGKKTIDHDDEYDDDDEKVCDECKFHLTNLLELLQARDNDIIQGLKELRHDNDFMNHLQEIFPRTIHVTQMLDTDDDDHFADNASFLTRYIIVDLTDPRTSHSLPALKKCMPMIMMDGGGFLGEMAKKAKAATMKAAAKAKDATINIAAKAKDATMKVAAKTKDATMKVAAKTKDATMKVAEKAKAASTIIVEKASNLREKVMSPKPKDDKPEGEQQKDTSNTTYKDNGNLSSDPNDDPSKAKQDASNTITENMSPELNVVNPTNVSQEDAASKEDPNVCQQPEVLNINNPNELEEIANKMTNEEKIELKNIIDTLGEIVDNKPGQPGKPGQTGGSVLQPLKALLSKLFSRIKNRINKNNNQPGNAPNVQSAHALDESEYTILKNELNIIEKIGKLDEKESAKMKLLTRYNNNPVTSNKSEELTITDRIVFIAATFVIRGLALFVVQWGVNTYMIRSFKSAFLLYIGAYIGIFVLWVLLTNASKNILFFRMMFYYVSTDPHGYMRILLHILLQLMFIPIPVIVQEKAVMGNDETDISFEKRRNVITTVSNFTFFMWLLTTLVAVNY